MKGGFMLQRGTQIVKANPSGLIVVSVACAIVMLACDRETPSVQQGGTAWAVGSFASNGERIYFTATDTSGQVISYSGGPSMGMMMGGGRLACVSCHGPGGRGGTHMMHMQSMKAPDVRWSALVGMHEEGHESGESHEHSHQGYDLETFRRAVVKGEHPDGDKLDRDMPRWDMNETDLRDLMNYLKALQ
jgi:mono/diheme cytochrome c family protein